MNRPPPSLLPVVLTLSPTPAVAEGLRHHLNARAEVYDCRDTASADTVLRKVQVDLLICKDDLPGETGLMFLARHAGDWPSMRRILLCPPLEPDLLLQVINEARVFRCIIEPCPAHELHRHADHALAEAVEARAQLLAYARSTQPERLVEGWIRILPRLAFLAGLTCGGAFLLCLVTLVLLYVAKSLLGIDLFSDAHLSSLWK